MNWLLIGIVLLVAGPLLAVLGAKQERKGNEPPQLVQYGYLCVVIGLFVLLVQYFSIAAAMLVFVVVTGVMWAYERWVGPKRRPQGVPAPDWLEYGRGFFTIILVVFVLRSFVAEPYQIPSSSMRPGLVVGDFILVNKFSYGIRVPVLNNVLIPVGKPEHGDVMVFNYPRDPSINYIKRVIGLPGDLVEYRGKRLTINGQPVPTEALGEHIYPEAGMSVANKLFSEKHGEHSYQTLQVPELPPFSWMELKEFPAREQCRYDDEGFVCKVPQGHYFMMGDNRDHSADSRYWGFVPEKYVVGKAFLVWMNFREFSRIGTAIR
jgi:signal peptidase I